MDGLDLKLKRVQAGLTLWQLGKLAGVHPARISEMARGQRLMAASCCMAAERVGWLHLARAKGWPLGGTFGGTERGRFWIGE